MTTSKTIVEQRKRLRIEVDQTAELLSADGTPHPAVLSNISGGGGQVRIAPKTAAALGLPQAPTLPFRLWLPGDEDLPLQGDAKVAYCRASEDGEAMLVGLEFGEVLAEGRQRIDEFIATCLRYAE
jgi:c-di-GMP-binding flagellar brake protein YcgR